jgi:hypothetical protein
MYTLNGWDVVYTICGNDVGMNFRYFKFIAVSMFDTYSILILVNLKILVCIEEVSNN